MQYCWVIYDVSDDKARRRLAKLCLWYGLQRVQRSVFFGYAYRINLQELGRQAALLVNPETDRVLCLKSSTDQIRQMLTIGQIPALIAPDDLLFF